MRETFTTTLHSPIGLLQITSIGKGVSSITLVDESYPNHEDEFTKQASDQLQEYFDGKRKIFDVKLDPAYGTEFQRKVWYYLTTIPYGKIETYKDVALAVANIKTIRAVGGANGANPIPIIVPCHRVIGSNGSLTGFALGTDVKKYLLNLENPARFASQLSLF